MKLFGHPIHFMLVHFPTALLPMDLVCSIVAYNGGSSTFLLAGLYAATGGVLMGWLSVISGCFDLVPAIRKKPKTIGRIITHGAINTSVILIYTVMILIRHKNYPDSHPDSAILLLTKGFLVSFMITGNFLGGRLVLKEGIGTELHN